MQPAVKLIDGISYYPSLIEASLCHRMKSVLMRESVHSGAEILTDGLRHQAPRLVSSYSDTPLNLEGMPESLVWAPELAELRDLVASTFSLRFNYALVNLYRDGDDYTGWHSDKAELHVAGSKIVIVALGASRCLSVRSYEAPQDAQEITMEEGSALVMDLDVQATHEHAVLRDSAAIGPRVSITLRSIRILDEYHPRAGRR